MVFFHLLLLTDSMSLNIVKYWTKTLRALKEAVFPHSESLSWRYLKWGKRNRLWNVSINWRLDLMRLFCINANVHDATLNEAESLEVDFCIPWQILSHVEKESRHEAAQAPTSHQRVIIDSSNVLNFTSKLWFSLT